MYDACAPFPEGNENSECAGCKEKRDVLWGIERKQKEKENNQGKKEKRTKKTRRLVT